MSINKLINTKLAGVLTVLGKIDPFAPAPVLLVWHHELGCPLVCKAFRSAAAARSEAALLELFSHPNIVRQFGVVASRLLLLEYLVGPTLKEALRAAPNVRFPFSDGLRTAIHLALAIRSLHQRGYLYLDLKPENVIVVNGVPKLIDMGTARRISTSPPSRVIGTDDYMSPEQRNKQKLSEASDVFSLGITLFELLTGKLPFSKAKSPSSGKSTSVSDGQPVARSLAKYLPTAKQELVEILRCCLSIDPKARPDLDTLIVSLNSLIRSGPKMWPAGMSL